MDRDSLGQHLYRHNHLDDGGAARHSLDDNDPFSPDASFAHRDTTGGDGGLYGSSNDETDESQSTDGDYNHNFSTGSWIKSTFSKLAKRNRLLSSVRQTLK